MEETKYEKKAKVSKFYTFLSDTKGNLLNDESVEIWSYWFEGEGLNILTNFPFSELFNIGETVDITYSHILYKNKKYSRNFYDDWGTTKFKIIDKTIFYSDVDYINGKELQPDFCPEPDIFYDIELVF